MRLQKLAGALANSNHHMQVGFFVTGGLQKSIVQQVMGKHPSIECKSIDKTELGIAMITSDFAKLLAVVELRNDSIMFAAKKRVVC